MEDIKLGPGREGGPMRNHATELIPEPKSISSEIDNLGNNFSKLQELNMMYTDGVNRLRGY